MTIARSDEGVAAVVGIVLTLAIVATVYAQTARTEVPLRGAEAERAWDAAVEASFSHLTRSAGNGVGQTTPVSIMFEPPPRPQSVDVPMMGRLAPATPTGVVEFKTSCGSFNATHTAGGTTSVDLLNGSRGCIEVRASTFYTRPFAYRSSFGGLVKFEGGRAVVLTGPAVELRATSASEYRVGMILPILTGAGQSASNSHVPVRVDFTPIGGFAEMPSKVNARNATLTMDTPFPAAWRDWWWAQFNASGFVASRPSPAPGESAADYTLTCANACVPVNGMGRVTIFIEGPRTDSEDLRYTLSTGVYGVTVR